MDQYKTGYLSGWERLGVGMKPVADQIAAVTSRGTHRLQFDFSRGYADAPSNMKILQRFPETQAVQCDAFYSDSTYLEGLENLKSFRDNAYNRRGLVWSKLSGVQDLALYDCHGKFHPDYAVFEDLKYLDTASLPKKYAFVEDLPVQGVKALSISKSHLKSFKGFECLKGLEALRINSCKEFSSSELVGKLPNVRYLSISFCRNVCSLEFLRCLPNLETLLVERLGEIASWEPLRGHISIRRIEAGPVQGAKVTQEIIETLPELEFISGHAQAQT
ncbi:MAG: hypothetical protein AAFQ58_09505 [Pseudomonadota bacterium]